MKNLLKNQITKYSLFSLMVTGLVGAAIETDRASRAPASAEQLHLEIQSLSLEQESHLDALDNVFVRVHMAGKESLEFLKEAPVSIAKGGTKSLNLKILIKPEWVENNNLSFSIELVKMGFVETIAVRCATVSKDVKEFSRALQCKIPGDKKPLLVYSLGTPNQELNVVSAN